MGDVFLDYPQAVQHLTEHPDEIYKAWSRPCAHVAGLLFSFVNPQAIHAMTDDNKVCGCLTTIATYQSSACTAKLTAAIRADKRLEINMNYPRGLDELKQLVPLLPVFAEWQRQIDQELERPSLAGQPISRF